METTTPVLKKVGMSFLVLAFLVCLPLSEVWSKNVNFKGQTDYPESRFGSSPADPISKKIREARVDADSDEEGMRAPASLKAPKEVVTNGNMITAVPKSQLGVQEISLIASEVGFYPKTLTVTQNVPVKLFVTSTVKNSCFIMDAFNIRKQVKLNQVDEVSFTPATVGQFKFSCPVNGRDGTLIVKE